MVKCYLMIEDVDDGTDEGQVQFAMNMGMADSNEMPATVDDMTPAQEAVWNFYNVLVGMFNRQHKVAMQREVQEGVVMPDNVVVMPGSKKIH